MFKLSLKYLAITAFIASINSCAFFNSDTVPVKITSQPQQAQVFINNQYYGLTPQILKIEAKNSKLTLKKAGFNDVEANLEVWTAVRRTRGDGIRCFADAMGTILILPAMSFFSSKCLDFKKGEYHFELEKYQQKPSSEGLFLEKYQPNLNNEKDQNMPNLPNRQMPQMNSMQYQQYMQEMQRNRN
jgi:hypothetical protein